MACGRLYGPISEYSSVKLNNYQRIGKVPLFGEKGWTQDLQKKAVVEKVNIFFQIIEKYTAKKDKRSLHHSTSTFLMDDRILAQHKITQQTQYAWFLYTLLWYRVQRFD